MAGTRGLDAYKFVLNTRLTQSDDQASQSVSYLPADHPRRSRTPDYRNSFQRPAGLLQAS